MTFLGKWNSSAVSFANESLFIPPASSLSCSSSAFQYSSVTTETRESITCHQIHVWLYPDHKFLKYPNLYWYLNGFEQPRALSVVCTLYKRKEWSDFFKTIAISKRSSWTFLNFSFIRCQCVFISVLCVCCCFFLTCPINCMFLGSLQINVVECTAV